jgi:hypothetical protein
MNQDTIKRFFNDTSESGRFMVTSNVTGIRYFIEPIGDGRGGDWGSYNPSTGNIEHKKGDGKYTGSVTLKESIITEENGFLNVDILDCSPLDEITRRDKEYEAQGIRRVA